MDMKQHKYVLPVSESLLAVIQQAIEQSSKTFPSGVVINFRDPEYSAERGGYHPVEIAIDEQGRLLYITDFSYVGMEPFTELAKELYFDFGIGLFQQLGVDYPIEQGRDIYTVWENNFLSYHGMGVYQVTVEGL